MFGQRERTKSRRQNIAKLLTTLIPNQTIPYHTTVVGAGAAVNVLFYRSFLKGVQEALTAANVVCDPTARCRSVRSRDLKMAAVSVRLLVQGRNSAQHPSHRTVALYWSSPLFSFTLLTIISQRRVVFYTPPLVVDGYLATSLPPPYTPHMLYPLFNEHRRIDFLPFPLFRTPSLFKM